MKNIRGKKNNFLTNASSLGIFATFLLITVFSVYFYSPVIKSHALGTGANVNNPVSKVGLNLESRLNLTIDKNELNLSGSLGEFTSGSLTIQVSTNSRLGYSVSIEDTDSNTDLVHSNPNVTNKFTSAFSGAKTSSTMDDNSWGFSLDNTNYYPVPVFGVPVRIAKTNAPSPEEPGYNTSQIAFGAKIGRNTTAGVYSDTVLFTAYANGLDETVIESNGTQTVLYNPGTTSIPTMQDFTCNDFEIGETIRLRDVRDGNNYSVKRLDDGNCWMLQNLRLVDKTLTSVDSDVASNFVLKASNSEDFAQFTEDGMNTDAVYLSNNSAYYTPYAATAGSLATAQFDSLSDGDIREFSSSVCPAGWHLPSVANMNYIDALYPNQTASSLNLSVPGPLYILYLPSEGGFTEYNQTGMKMIALSSYGKVTTPYSDDTSFIDALLVYLSAGDSLGMPYPLPVSEITDIDDGGIFAFPVRCINGTSTPPSEYEGYKGIGK